MTQQLFVTAASVHERIMGEHLRTWSETEYTNAGEVMQNVGKIQEGDAKKRYQREGEEGEREREGEFKQRKHTTLLPLNGARISNITFVHPFKQAQY